MSRRDNLRLHSSLIRRRAGQSRPDARRERRGRALCSRHGGGMRHPRAHGEGAATQRRARARLCVRSAVTVGICWLAGSLSPALAAAQPVELAAPYEYLGWGDPQPPASVIEATGVHDLTLAFVLSTASATPEWDGSARCSAAPMRPPSTPSVRPAGKWTCPSAAGAGKARQLVRQRRGARRRLSEGHRRVLAERHRHRHRAHRVHRQEGAPAGDRSTGDRARRGPRPGDIRHVRIDRSGPRSGRAEPDLGCRRDRLPADVMDDHAVRLRQGDTEWATPRSGRRRTGGGSRHGYDMPLAGAYEHAGISSMDGHTDEASETVASRTCARCSPSPGCTAWRA